MMCSVQAIQFYYNGQAISSHQVLIVLIFQNNTLVKSHAVMTFAWWGKPLEGHSLSPVHAYENIPKEKHCTQHFKWQKLSILSFAPVT